MFDFLVINTLVYLLKNGKQYALTIISWYSSLSIEIVNNKTNITSIDYVL